MIVMICSNMITHYLGCHVIFHRFAFSRVTSENTCLMKDITYLELVDVDPSPMNRIVNICYPKKKEFLRCPHHIITRIANVARNNISEFSMDNKVLALGNDVSNINSDRRNGDDHSAVILQDLLQSNQSVLEILRQLKNKVDELDEKLKKI